MLYTVRFLQPIRACLAPVFSPSLQFSSSGIPLIRQLRPCKIWKGLKPEALDISRLSQWRFDVYKYHQQLHNFCKSGGMDAMGGVLFFSAVSGSLRHRPCVAYSSDGFGVIEDDHKLNWPRGSDSERDRHALLTILRRYVVPFFLILTVLLNWGHPMIIGAKVTLLLLSTKPNPSSIYLFVEELRHQAMRKRPLLYTFKSLYARELEVADYTFLCLARVELSGTRYTLLGIPGNWWVLPVSSWQEARLVFTKTVRKQFS